MSWPQTMACIQGLVLVLILRRLRLGAMQDAASSLHRAVREAEDAAEERLSAQVRNAKREADRIHMEMTDAAAAQDTLLKVCTAAWCLLAITCWQNQTSMLGSGEGNQTEEIAVSTSWLRLGKSVHMHA